MCSDLQSISTAWHMYALQKAGGTPGGYRTFPWPSTLGHSRASVHALPHALCPLALHPGLNGWLRCVGHSLTHGMQTGTVGRGLAHSQRLASSRARCASLPPQTHDPRCPTNHAPLRAQLLGRARVCAAHAGAPKESDPQKVAQGPSRLRTASGERGRGAAPISAGRVAKQHSLNFSW